MKKALTPLLLCLLLLLSGCAGKGDKASDVPKGYIAEGVQITLRLLVENNAFLTQHVFAEHLPTDESDSVTQDGIVYVRVTDQTYNTYEALESLVRATYTEEAAQALLARGVYRGIEGKLYYRTDAGLPAGEGYADAVDYTIENGVRDGNALTFDAVSAHGRTTMTAVKSGSSWLLMQVYQ